MSSTWLKNLRKLFGQELLDFGQPNLIQCLFEGQVDKKIFLLLCNNSIFFLLKSNIYVTPLTINYIFERTMYSSLQFTQPFEIN